MINHFVYTQALLSTLNQDQIGLTVGALAALSRLIETRGPKIAAISPQNFDRLMSALDGTPTHLRQLVRKLYQDHQLDQLPRLYASVERELARRGQPIINVEIGSTSDAINHLISKNAHYLIRTNPRLIAGARVSTRKSSVEYSIDSQLGQIERTLNEG